MQQLTFNLQTAENLDPYSTENFVVLEENSAAFNFLGKFFSQNNFSQSQFPSLILKGPKASGKTHLLNIFAKKFQGEFLDFNKITHKNLASFFTPHRFYILENIDEIQNEELLLHLINSAFEAKAFLILSTTNLHQFQLKDLSSRLKNIFSLQIKDPCVATIKTLLINAFARRQIKVSSRIIDFIGDNISRNYAAILTAINLVELENKESGKNLSLKKIEEILKNSLPS